jgi:hypothetical protein
MSPSALSSEARQVFTFRNNSGASLRRADEDICPNVVRKSLPDIIPRTRSMAIPNEP